MLTFGGHTPLPSPPSRRGAFDTTLPFDTTHPSDTAPGGSAFGDTVRGETR
jgi:hypothetical protein